jgi:hypothetical protein
MYRAIARAADDPNRICVSPRRFKAQMRYLKRRGLRGLCAGVASSGGYGACRGLVRLNCMGDGWYLDARGKTQALPVVPRDYR